MRKISYYAAIHEEAGKVVRPWAQDSNATSKYLTFINDY
jgi:hypothetical protein